MINNPCVQIFERLDRQEFKEMCNFVKKTLPPGNQEFELFNHLEACYPNYNEDNIGQEVLAALLFNDRQIDKPARNLSTIANRLHKILQEYLVDRSLKNNHVEREFLLTYEYSRLGLRDLLDKRIEHLQQAIPVDPKALKESTSSNINVWYHWHLYRMFHLRYYSRDTIKTAPDEMNLVHSLEQLDKAYVASRLRIALEMSSLHSINGRTPEISFTLEELQQFKINGIEKDPFFFLYATAYELVIDPSFERYEYFKNQLHTHGNYLSKDEHGNLLAILINYASQSIRNGALNFYNEAVELHLYGLNNRVLLQDGKITPEILLNLINTSYEANRIETAAEQLKEWADFLPRSIKHEAMCTLNSRIFFYTNKYQDAVKEFSKIKRFQNHLLELSARTTTIQCYYETKDFSALDSFCDSFTKTLNRNVDRFSPEYRSSFGNFNKMIHTISKAYFKSTPNRKEKLLQKVEKFPTMVCKKWVVAKINELPK